MILNLYPLCGQITTIGVGSILKRIHAGFEEGTSEKRELAREGYAADIN